MRLKVFLALVVTIGVAITANVAGAQELGSHFKKLKDGIFVYSQKPADSNATIILTSEGVVLIDSGHRPPDSVALAAAVKKLSCAS